MSLYYRFKASWVAFLTQILNFVGLDCLIHGIINSEIREKQLSFSQFEPEF